MLLGRRARMIQRGLELVRPLLELVGQLGHLVEQLLGLDALAAARLDRRYRLTDLLGVLERGRQHVAVRHQHGQLAFDVHGLVVRLDHDLVAGVDFALVEYLVLVEQRDGVLRGPLRQGIDRVLQVEQAALGRFLGPLGGVAVAVEDDPLVLLDDLRQEFAGGLFDLLAGRDGLLEFGRDEVERLGDRDVQRDVRVGDALVRRHRAELELVAGEGERAGAVAVARVTRQLRQDADAGVEHAAALGRLRATLFDLLEDVRQHVAEEDRDDGGRRFVRTESVVVAGAGDGRAQQALVLVDRADDRRAEHQKLDVVVRVLAGRQQVVALIITHRPVEVLARAVDAGERLFVHQARQAVLRRNALQGFHHHHLVIGGDVRGLEHRRDFVLARRHFVVARLHRHAQRVELGFALRHVREDTVGDRTEVLIFQFLALGRRRAEQRAASVDQVGTREVEVAIDQEVFLLGAAGRGDPRGLRTEQLQDAPRVLREGIHRAEQRRLLVERLTGPAQERCRDNEGDRATALEQPHRAGRVPRRVAARLEGAAQAARREARRIGLAPDQFLARELEDGLAVGGRVEEGVVLLGRDAGQRLEPVRVVGRAVLDRPFLRGLGHRVGHRAVERFGLHDGAAQRLVHLLRQTLLLFRVVENQAAERKFRTDGRRPFLSHGPVANCADRFAQHCGTHRVPLRQ